MSGITLQPSTDMLQSWQVLSGAFGPEAPMLDEMYPMRNEPAGAKRTADRLSRKLKKNIGMVSIDAIIDGQIAGVAVWQFMDELPPMTIQEWEQDWEATWPEDDERQYLQEMWPQFMRPRYDAMLANKADGKKVLVLEYLGVNPEFRRRGVGETLVAWGIKQADEQGIHTVLEGTTDGNKLYRRVGFEDVAPIVFEGISEKFAHKKKPELVFMRRLPRPVAAQS